jgi:hypothetical protein
MSKFEKASPKPRKFAFISSGGYELFNENAETNRNFIGDRLHLYQL